MSNVIYFLNMLNSKYEQEKEDMSKLEYLSEFIFDFTTYDSDISELFALKAIEVCYAINSKSTFKYIEDKENYKWYLIMINMPFFNEKLDWGTSIRGAWWTFEDIKIIDLFNFTELDWKDFISAIIEFSKDEIIQHKNNNE